MKPRVYLMPTSEIKDSSYIDDNIEDKLINISLLDAQEMILEPLIGSALFEKLYDDVYAGTLTTEYTDLLTDYIWPVLLQGSVYRLSYNLLFRITNSSVVKDSNENSTGISINELNVLIREREQSLNYHSKKLTAYLTAYSTTFPEYLGAVPLDGVSPDQTTDYSVFWNYDED